MKSEKFCRMRIGIAIGDIMEPAEKYVLSTFDKSNKKTIAEMIEKACVSIEYYLSHNIKETMNQFNKKTNMKGTDG